MPALDEYRKDDYEQLPKLDEGELNDRQRDIATRWDYYDGEHPKPLKVKPKQGDDNVIVNIMAKVVDQGVSLLFPEEINYEFEEGEETPEEERLAEIWEQNREPIFLQDLATAGGVSGHCFVKLRLEDGPDGVWPRFIRLPAEMVSVFWQPDDIEKVTAYKMAWESGEGSEKVEHQQHVVLIDDDWWIRDIVKGRNNRWTLESEERWEWDFCPIIDWKNLPNPRGYYGQSDMRDMGANDSVNFLASNTQRIIKYHAHPRTVGTGIGKEDMVQSSISGFWAVGTPEARIYNLEMTSDLASSLNWLAYLVGYVYSRHQAVDIASLRDRLGRLTNFQLQTLYKDALDKLRVKRILYGKALMELSRRALVMVGQSNAEAPTIHWPDPLPYNDLEEIQAIQTEMELGILSRETAASLRGRDWELERERLTSEIEGVESLERWMAAMERSE